MLRHSTLVAGLALAGTLTSCVNPPPDAGHEAFIAWATVAVLGRRAYDHGELQALTRLADRRGREAVLDVLMEQPEFADHWTALLFEDLGVAKSNGSFAGTERAADPACYNTQVLSTFHDEALVQHLRFADWDDEFCPGPVLQDLQTSADGTRTARQHDPDLAIAPAQRSREELDRLAGDRSPRRLASPMLGIEPGGVEYLGPTYTGAAPAGARGGVEGQPTEPADPPPPSCGSFTLRDAARASIREDRLDALYRVALVPLAAHNTSTGVSRAKFLDGWLDRDPGCVECHTTHYSTTNAMPRNDDWDRYFPPFFLDLEGTTFSWEADGLYNDGAAGGDVVAANIGEFFREDAHWEGGGGFQPFAIHESCVIQSGDADRTGFRGILSAKVDGDGVPVNAGLAGMYGNTLGPLDLVNAFAVGASQIDMVTPDIVPAPVPYLAGLTGSSANGEALWLGCVGSCHDPASPAANAPVPLHEHIYDMSGSRLYDIVVNGSPAGLMGSVSNEQGATDIVAYVTGDDYPHPRYEPKVYAEPAVGFAHLTAQTIANNVYEHLRGASLTLEHRGVRNQAASDRLFELTAHFVDDGWSLRSLIKRIALSKETNGLAPVDAPDASPYGYAMLFEPWADVNEGVQAVDVDQGEDSNGQGDVVQRWPLASLLHQVHHALFWPAPVPVPSTDPDDHGDATFYQEAGGYVNFNDPGMPEVVVTSLLAWEDEVDRCAHRGLGQDYIDVLVDPEHDLTVRQALLALKGRLLSDPRFYDGDALGPPSDDLPLADEITVESSTIAAALGVDLDAPAEDHPQAVRDYCASLLLSPQFLLGGLPAWDAQHAPPDVDDAIPCVDDRCGFGEHCEYYREEAVELGYDDFSCGFVIEEVLKTAG